MEETQEGLLVENQSKQIDFFEPEISYRGPSAGRQMLCSSEGQMCLGRIWQCCKPFKCNGETQRCLRPRKPSNSGKN